MPYECEPQRTTLTPPSGSTPLCQRTSPHWKRPRALGKTPRIQVAEVKHPLTNDTPLSTHSGQQLEHTAAQKQTEQWTLSGHQPLRWDLPSRSIFTKTLTTNSFALHCTSTNLHCQHRIKLKRDHHMPALLQRGRHTHSQEAPGSSISNNHSVDVTLGLHVS